MLVESSLDEPYALAGYAHAAALHPDDPVLRKDFLL